ncbi:MAG TPA: tRNA (adenosine(37)-N6)-threonylcarbamoyltransferase complex dimerization subunit type 1 TsaB [Solirubrobacteraceae bacterium]|nr:tRNA (adenosine(37)-N6)-threonylcarbamoyltransferase complex dimerization subunit type 1 TsaB [Solirubrobacteraceae bacterium]
MIVLGLDTATPSTVVGLRLADGTTLQARDDPVGGERPGHTTRLLPLASALLAQAGLGWSELERIAVGVGPGTFTGLRIGIATARGLAQSLDAELVGVSSLRALAHGLGYGTPREMGAGERVPGDEHAGKEASRVVLAAIDARRGELFVAGYDRERELLAPQPISPESVGRLLESAGIEVGIEVCSEQWIALGDGAVRYRDAFAQAGVSVPPDGYEGHHIQASAICALAVAVSEATAADAAVVPDYRRRPDAEVALEGAA